MSLDEDAIFEDERAHRIGYEVFNPKDGCYDKRRREDRKRFRDCIAKLVALGYPEAHARRYLNTELSYCEPAADHQQELREAVRHGPGSS